MLEGVVHDGFQHQAVADVRWAAEMEHVDAPEGRVSVTQAAGLRRGNTRQLLRCLRFLGGGGWKNVKYGR